MISIILAAGTGKRMRSSGRQKVCFEVGDVPVILRAVRCYDAAGVRHHIIVIGEHADQVIKAVGRAAPNVTFAYQPEPLGTGNAARCGARILKETGYTGCVLVVAGDKIVQPRVVTALDRERQRSKADLILLTGDKSRNPTSGRVLTDPQGRPAGIVELSEIRLSKAIEEIDRILSSGGDFVLADQILDAIHRQFPDRTKARRAFGELYEAASGREAVSSDEVREHLQPLRKLATVNVWHNGQYQAIPAAEVESKTETVNLSVYLVTAPALHFALGELSRDNAQREEFLTDIVRILADTRLPDGTQRFSLAAVPLEDPDDVLSFNTPEELAEIDRIFRVKYAGMAAADVLPKPCKIRTIAQWQRLLSSRSRQVTQVFQRIYGDDRTLHETKRKQYLRALALARARIGPERLAAIIRSPGRINLLGRHIDHRGGCVNVMAISEEILMVAAPRDDDQVHLHNTDAEAFADTSFSISEEIAKLDWGDWLTCVNSPKTLAVVQNGSWDNYVKAAALRLKHEVKSAPLRGADIVTHGTIPVGSGLSSSSAVVVGAAEALIALNGLPIRPSTLVDLCGEGEWFVGTRGGQGDHAAIKLARRGCVAHIGFFPFRVLDFMPFPPNHRLIVANSGEQAKKSENARETFNSRILGYVMAELIFKREFPELAPSIHHLRDITCENLGLGLAELYQMLTRIPVTITEQEFLACYGPFSAEDNAKIAALVSTLKDRGKTYAPRGLLIFCLAECERAELCVDLLKRGDADGLGRLWQISHDGDRVVRYDENMIPSPYAADVSDGMLDDLAVRLTSANPAAAHSAYLHEQPGVYACSTPGVDRIVDMVLGLPGVKGAQIAGAGLGGCVMILVAEEEASGVLNALHHAGYPAVEYQPVEGAGWLEI